MILGFYFLLFLSKWASQKLKWKDVTSKSHTRLVWLMTSFCEDSLHVPDAWANIFQTEVARYVSLFYTVILLRVSTSQFTKLEGRQIATSFGVCPAWQNIQSLKSVSVFVDKTDSQQLILNTKCAKVFCYFSCAECLWCEETFACGWLAK